MAKDQAAEIERKHLSADALFRCLRGAFEEVPNHRPAGATIGLADGLMAGFAVFALKDPSLLAFDQRRREDAKNLEMIFHIQQVPCDTQMREILDPVDPEALRPAFRAMFRQLQRGKVLERMVFFEGHYLLSLDGTGYFSSEKVHCDSCMQKTSRNGKVSYYHQMLGAVLVHPDTAMRIMRGGRARWKVENETFNTLKNQGYHFEHNYGHGKQNLSIVLAMLMMLAFLVDQTQQLACQLFQSVWNKLGSKRHLWESVRAVFRAFAVTSMREIYVALLYGFERAPPRIASGAAE